MELTAEIGRSIRSSFHEHASSFRSSVSADAARASMAAENIDDDEVELQWAAIERLPTFRRIRTSLFDQKLLNHGRQKENDDDAGKSVIDVTELGALERHVFIEKLIQKFEEDNYQLLQKLKERINK